MTPHERNEVLEEAAGCVENLGEPHYFQFAASMVRELKREEPPQTKSKIIPCTVFVPAEDGTVAETVEVKIPLEFDTEIGVWVLTQEAHLIIDSTKAERIRALKGRGSARYAVARIEEVI